MALTPSVQTMDRRVRAWIAEGSNIPTRLVIESKGGGPAPATSLYASVLVEQRRALGVHWIEDDAATADPPETQRQLTVLEFAVTYSVQWLNDGAYEAAQRFAVWAAGDESKTMQLGLDDGASFALQRLGDLRDLSVVQSEQADWEERMGMDVDVSYQQALNSAVMRFSVPSNAGDVPLTIELLEDGVRYEGNG